MGNTYICVCAFSPLGFPLTGSVAEARNLGNLFDDSVSFMLSSNELSDLTI